MAGDVGEGFLGDAVGGDLRGGGEIRQAAWRVDRDVEPIRAELGGRLADGTDEAGVIKGGRAEGVDQATNIRDSALRLLLQPS